MAVHSQEKASPALSKSSKQKIRKKKGTLKEQQVQPAARFRYKAAVALLLSYWAMFAAGPSRFKTWDEATAEYIEHIYAEGESLALAADTLAGLQYMHTRALGHLKESWRLVGIWRRSEPPCRVLPFLPIMALGLAGSAFSAGLIDVCALILVGFNVFLRTSEMLDLRICCITFSSNRASLKLCSTKTGKRKGIDEHVTVTSSLAVQMLKLAVRKRPKSERVCQRTPYAFRKVFKHLMGIFHLQVGEYNVYSLRRGGATAYFTQCGSLDKTLITGRWEHASTARIYIEEATAQASEMKLTDTQLSLLRLAASKLKELDSTA